MSDLVRVSCIRGFLSHEGEKVRPGDVVEIPAVLAAAMVSCNKATMGGEGKAKAKAKAKPTKKKPAKKKAAKK